MSEESAGGDLRQVAQRLRGAETLALVTHVNPDGDALGSMVGLARAARATGRTVHTMLQAAVTGRYEFLLAEEQPVGPEGFAEAADAADMVVVLDTCAAAQLGTVMDELRRRKPKVVVIDHHQRCEDIGSVQWVETGTSAVGVMVGELLRELDWPLDLTAARALAAAALSDTGWLRYANTDARCLRAVADWVERGVRPDRLYRRIYQADRPERLRLLARMLESLRLCCDGRVALAVLRQDDFERSGARESETEDLVNEPMRLASVEVSALVIESGESTRASLRSREVVDVAEIARQFGGGGHERAAGLRVDEPPEALCEKLLAACEKALTAT